MQEVPYSSGGARRNGKFQGGRGSLSVMPGNSSFDIETLETLVMSAISAKGESVILFIAR